VTDGRTDEKVRTIAYENTLKRTDNKIQQKVQDHSNEFLDVFLVGDLGVFGNSVFYSGEFRKSHKREFMSKQN
jgi:hypothetical protein